MHNEYDEADVGRMIGQLVGAVRSEFPADRQLNVVGIRTRGETLADRIAKALADAGYTKIGRGVLDITLYRDDLSEIGPRPLVRPTVLDIPIDGNPLVLVDDVLFTGRSVRAALGAIADYGRPSAVRLAVLVDRGGRELPIQPDYLGLKLPEVPRTHRVKVKLSENDRCKDGIVVEPRDAPNH
jgi:pyrimidine operon attenuation protein/uracil phosphoribosyltransferase